MIQFTNEKTNRSCDNKKTNNEEHGITPKTIKKDVRELIRATVAAEEDEGYEVERISKIRKMPKKARAEVVEQMEEEMREAAKQLDFERATELRDIIFELKVE